MDAKSPTDAPLSGRGIRDRGGQPFNLAILNYRHIAPIDYQIMWGPDAGKSEGSIAPEVRPSGRTKDIHAKPTENIRGQLSVTLIGTTRFIAR